MSFKVSIKEGCHCMPSTQEGLCTNRHFIPSHSEGVDLRFQGISLETCQKWMSRSLLRGSGNANAKTRPTAARASTHEVWRERESERERESARARESIAVYGVGGHG
jgi:hypothetical protein